MVIPPKFKDATIFREGLCAVKKEGKWGYIDKKGNTVIPFKYVSATEFEDGFAQVEFPKNKKYITITIDRTGKWVD